MITNAGGETLQFPSKLLKSLCGVRISSVGCSKRGLGCRSGSVRTTSLVPVLSRTVTAHFQLESLDGLCVAPHAVPPYRTGLGLVYGR
eukprot:5149070-Pleurochrysis_carterae.AAC.2